MQRATKAPEPVNFLAKGGRDMRAHRLCDEERGWLWQTVLRAVFFPRTDSNPASTTPENGPLPCQLALVIGDPAPGSPGSPLSRDTSHFCRVISNADLQNLGAEPYLGTPPARIAEQASVS
jgi:hypothetical protein